MDEYEQINRLRELWTNAIMTWGQIFIPLGAAIIAFFVTQFPDFADRGWGTHFLLVGWLIFSFCMIYWRWIVHEIDRQIVGMYPRMLELEKEMNMETQTAYYYRNLNKRSIKYLADEYGIQFNDRNNQDFIEFKTKVEEKKGNIHELLLKVWDEHKDKSVGSRGHCRQDFAVSILIVGFLTAIILFSDFHWFTKLVLAPAIAVLLMFFIAIVLDSEYDCLNQ